MPHKALERFNEAMEEGVEAILMVAFFSLVVLIPYLSATGVSDEHPWVQWPLVGLAVVLIALIIISRLVGGPGSDGERIVPKAISEHDGNGDGPG